MINIKNIVFDLEGTLLISNGGKNIEISEHIISLLDDLKKLGINCFIWTSRDRFSTLEILKKSKILPFFEDIRCCFSDCASKPSPEGIKEMIPSKYSNQTLVIGDSTNDIIGGNSFKAITIKALWYYSEFKEELDQKCIEYFVKNGMEQLNELRDINDLGKAHVKLNHPNSLLKIFFKDYSKKVLD